jgi:hypothetical protein
MKDVITFNMSAQGFPRSSLSEIKPDSYTVQAVIQPYEQYQRDGIPEVPSRQPELAIKLILTRCKNKVMAIAVFLSP